MEAKQLLRDKGAPLAQARTRAASAGATAARPAWSWHRRVTRYLQRQGHLPREFGESVDSSAEPELLALISAASVPGLCALPTESKPPVLRLGARREFRKPFVPGSLCHDYEGFSLHAQVLVPEGQRERLEHLCRYVARPAIATERLSLAPDGRVIYRLRRHWRDGTSAVSFDPLTIIERLAAQVPSAPLASAHFSRRARASGALSRSDRAGSARRADGERHNAGRWRAHKLLPLDQRIQLAQIDVG